MAQRRKKPCKVHHIQYRRRFLSKKQQISNLLFGDFHFLNARLAFEHLTINYRLEIVESSAEIEPFSHLNDFTDSHSNQFFWSPTLKHIIHYKVHVHYCGFLFRGPFFDCQVSRFQ